MIRTFVFIICFTLLVSCSYKRDIDNLNNVVSHDFLVPVNKKGNYSILLYKAEELSGKALHMGSYCSAHKFPYEFGSLFDSEVSNVLDNVYEEMHMEVVVRDEPPERKRDVEIYLKPADVRVTCPPLTPMNQVCVATTKISAEVHDPERKEYAIEVETRGSASAGGMCAGGAEAIATSIGTAINEFNKKLYDHLILK